MPSDVYPQDAISDVRSADSVVAATVVQDPGAHSILVPAPEARAMGVRANCLVEVEVSFTGIAYPSDRGSADVETSAVDIARAMMHKISSLS